MTNTIDTKDHTDIKRLVWIEKFIPTSTRPYAYLMRLDRPIGIWLLLLPGFWGVSLASNGVLNLHPSNYHIPILFIIGAIIMRGAGCVVNDLWDHDLDKMIERTKSRPIASGEVSPLNGLIFMATLLLVGLFILLQFNKTTIILGMISIPLIISYPLMKRITWWPQAFLGLTFNFSALMGYCAITNDITTAVILLYIGGIFWTLGYDTIYAHQDKDDDLIAGVKSTALRFGKNSKIWVGLFYTLSISSILCAQEIEHGMSIKHTVSIIPIMHLTWQICVWKTNNKQSSLSIFKSNQITGLMILLALSI